MFVMMFYKLAPDEQQKVRQEIRQKPCAENGFDYLEEDLNVSVLEKIRFGLLEVKADREGKHKLMDYKTFLEELDKDEQKSEITNISKNDLKSIIEEVLGEEEN